MTELDRAIDLVYKYHDNGYGMSLAIYKASQDSGVPTLSISREMTRRREANKKQREDAIAGRGKNFWWQDD